MLKPGIHVFKGYDEAVSKSMIKMMGLRNYVAVLSLAVFFLCTGTHASEECERLQASLTYTQEQAPRDLSGLVSLSVICLCFTPA
jgi:hypothetical protein